MPHGSCCDAGAGLVVLRRHMMSIWKVDPHHLVMGSGGEGEMLSCSALSVRVGHLWRDLRRWETQKMRTYKQEGGVE